VSLLDQFKWSLRHSRRQLLESTLVVFAIGLGIGVIITVLTMFLRLGEEYGRIREMDYFRTVEILGRGESAQWQSTPITVIGSELNRVTWGASLDEVLELQRQLPPDMYVFVELSLLAETHLLPQEADREDGVWYGFRGNQLFISCTVPAYFAFKNVEAAQGNLFLLDDVLSASRVLVLTDTLARDLFGEQNPIGQVVPLSFGPGQEAEDFTVIGVLSPPEGDMYSVFNERRTAWAPITVMPSYRLGFDDATKFYNISVGLDEDEDLAAAVELVRREAALMWGEEAIDVRNPLDSWRESMQQVQRYALLIGTLASVGLVIAVINILNLMLARLLKRTKSIGLSMALGSSRAQVFRQFMLEAVVLGLAGAVLGILLSFGFSEIVKQEYGEFAAGRLSTRLGLGIGLGFLISLFFGVYPAYLGSRVNPVDALRID